MKNRRVSIVVGAARGIGHGIAQGLARRGDRLVLVDLLFRDPKTLASVKAGVEGEPVLAAVDVTVPYEVEHLAAETLDRFGRIDCLVNSAGICRPAPIQEIDLNDWQAVMGVNLTGRLSFSPRAVAQVMIQSRSTDASFTSRPRPR